MRRGRTTFPPTPAPSTDITGKNSTDAIQFDSSFALPPSAIESNRSSTSSSAASHESDSSYRPLSPTSPRTTTKACPTSRKRSSASQNVVTNDDYSLPPPPMRPRKIIQMDPKKSQQQAPSSANTKATPTSGAGTKKKNGAASTAQGRKIARKTAHSLIERRRRSKMNEEFGVLKDMIPGCKDQEMHKLSILQASIEYTRYLEQCVSDLKAAHRARRDASSPISPVQRLPPSLARKTTLEKNDDNDEAEDREEQDDHVDQDMQDASLSPPAPTHNSPPIHPTDQTTNSTTPSPNLFAQSNPPRHPIPIPIPTSTTASSVTSDHLYLPSTHSYATSPLQASPIFNGQIYHSSQFRNSISSATSRTPSFPSMTDMSGAHPMLTSPMLSSPGLTSPSLTSPALEPQTDRDDHEATEALLMLNTDRRRWGEGPVKGKRGMSVRDLLSG